MSSSSLVSFSLLFAELSLPSDRSPALNRRGGKAVRLTYDHKGSDAKEAKRITDAGGFVMNNRVNGAFLSPSLISLPFVLFLPRSSSAPESKANLSYPNIITNRSPRRHPFARRFLDEGVCRRLALHYRNDFGTGRRLLDCRLRWGVFSLLFRPSRDSRQRERRRDR